MNLTTILSKLGISTSLTQDITLLLVIILASFLFGVFIGRSRLMAVLVNIYVSLAIVMAIPASYLADYSYKILAFLIILVFLTLWGKKIIDVSMGNVGSGFMWKIFALSFLEVVLILSIIVSLTPKKNALQYVSASSYGYLIDDPMKLIWMAAPLIFLFFVHGRSR